jgi:purine-nucleoside/S-methyl-5'-thioadenosine phosphorylase / adenosine deaminase
MVMPLPQPSESFAWTQEPWGPALRCTPLLALAPHLFTSAAISVSRDAGDPALASVAASLGLGAEAIVQVHQVHGRKVINGDTHLFSQSCEKVSVPFSAADALVSGSPQRAVGVRVADCVPILLADTKGRAVAAVHAGWRGTAAGVVRAAVHALREQFGVSPADLFAALGPSIRACCYEVGPELRIAFSEAGHEAASLNAWFSQGRGDRLSLDVPRVNRDELYALGVPMDQIFDSHLCTACHDGVFHSYRRHGAEAGRMLAVIRAL